MHAIRIREHDQNKTRNVGKQRKKVFFFVLLFSFFFMNKILSLGRIGTIFYNILYLQIKK